MGRSKLKQFFCFELYVIRDGDSGSSKYPILKIFGKESFQFFKTIFCFYFGGNFDLTVHIYFVISTLQKPFVTLKLLVNFIQVFQPQGQIKEPSSGIDFFYNSEQLPTADFFTEELCRKRGGTSRSISKIYIFGFGLLSTKELILVAYSFRL